ncbi:MAG TPA: metallophosphoesterase [Polyangiaceae bacterium]|nr:metallophosphoesterase [Polyangiaceae bacterium]
MPRGVPASAVVCAVVGVVALTWPSGEPQAAPRSPVQPTGFGLAVISDLNQGYGSTVYGRDVHAAVRALTERLRPGLVLITGDMVAGQRSGVDAPAMWRGFRSAVIEPLRRAGIAIAPTPGNHDASPSFTTERAEYVGQWQARDAGLDFIDAERYPLRYSFSFQGAFFLSLDAASVGPLSAEQRGWVEQQLDNAKSFPVKIAFGHLPLHPIARGREREILNDDKLEALFVRHGVDLYASGHQHAYYPGATPGLRQLAMPCLGAGARALIGTSQASASALALLRIDGPDVTEVEAFAAPDFTKVIARETLPPRITLGRHTLVRDDLPQ